MSIMWNVPLIDLKTHVLQPEALALVPEELARKHILIPLQIVGDSLMVVMADPDDYIAINDIFTRTNMKIQVAFRQCRRYQKSHRYLLPRDGGNPGEGQGVPAGGLRRSGKRPGFYRRNPHYGEPGPPYPAGGQRPRLGYSPGAAGQPAAHTLPHRRDTP